MCLQLFWVSSHCKHGCSFFVYYQSAVIGVLSCATQFPSTRVRKHATLGGDNKEHNSLSTPPQTYPVSCKISSATMQNYDIIACYPSRQALYHCVGLMARLSKFWDTSVSRLSSVINHCQRVPWCYLIWVPTQC